MFSRTVRRVIQQKRNFSVFDRKNTIAEARTKFYSNPAVGADNPTYLKEPADKVYVIVGFTGMTIGLTCLFKGLVSMSLGRK